MLKSTISKPQVIDSECPVIMHDFLNHVRLFEMLPHALYDWVPNNDPWQEQGQSVVISRHVGDKLCMVQPNDSLQESQRFDTLVTQQWLRVSMWRLAFGARSGFGLPRGLLTNLTIPFDAGKPIMSQLDLIPQSSRDCHGISIVSFFDRDVHEKMILKGNRSRSCLISASVLRMHRWLRYRHQHSSLDQLTSSIPLLDFWVISVDASPISCPSFFNIPKAFLVACQSRHRLTCVGHHWETFLPQLSNLWMITQMRSKIYRRMVILSVLRPTSQIGTVLSLQAWTNFQASLRVLSLVNRMLRKATQPARDFWSSR